MNAIVTRDQEVVSQTVDDDAFEGVQELTGEAWSDPEGDDGDLDEDAIPTNPFDFKGTLADYADEDEEDEDNEREDFFRHEEKSRVPGINEGDFILPEQRFLFKRLKMRIRQACNVNSKHDVRQRALEWIFVPGTEDAVKVAFTPACQALGARPIVMQARTMHQLWKANIHLSEPLPFMTIPPPKSVLSEISARIGPGLPEDMAREVWFWPSIPVAELRSKFPQASTKQCQLAIDSLMANGYIGVASARAYFISRNPSILPKGARERFAFSASIYGD